MPNMLNAAGTIGGGLIGGELLGNVVQICFVSRDHKRTIHEFLKLGIGPWQIRTLHPGTLSETRFRGDPHSYRVITASTSASNMIWEIVEPLDGTGIFQEFLEAHGEGVHHLAFLCPGRSFHEAIEEYARRGFHVIQSGRWMDQVSYAFLGTDDALGTFFELWDHPPGFQRPAPDEVYPPLDPSEAGE